MTSPRYVMVPVEPSEEMLDGEARTILLNDRMGMGSKGRHYRDNKATVLANIYRAMISAAPSVEPSEMREAIARVIDSAAFEPGTYEYDMGGAARRPVALTKADAILSLISAAPVHEGGEKWRDIASAPMFGWFDVWRDGVRFPDTRRQGKHFATATGAWKDGQPVVEWLNPPPTHWMPLPNPPPSEKP